MTAVFVNPPAMTVERYHQVRDHPHEAGAPHTGRRHHPCFGEEGHLTVFDIWETREDFDAFAAHLVPILDHVGMAGPPPVVMPVVSLDG